MARRPFHELTHAVDEAVDEHLGDDFTIYVNGETLELRSTLSSDQIEQELNGMVAIVNRTYLSVQQRLIPARLKQDGAVVERTNYYKPGNPVERFTVIAVEPEDSGRVKIIIQEI